MTEADSVLIVAVFAVRFGGQRSVGSSGHAPVKTGVTAITFLANSEASLASSRASFRRLLQCGRHFRFDRDRRQLHFRTHVLCCCCHLRCWTKCGQPTASVALGPTHVYTPPHERQRFDIKRFCLCSFLFFFSCFLLQSSCVKGDLWHCTETGTEKSIL